MAGCSCPACMERHGKLWDEVMEEPVRPALQATKAELKTHQAAQALYLAEKAAAKAADELLDAVEAEKSAEKSLAEKAPKTPTKKRLAPDESAISLSAKTLRWGP